MTAVASFSFAKPTAAWGLYTAPVRILGAYGGPTCLVTYSNGDRTEYVMTGFECKVRSGTLRAVSDETTCSTCVAAEDLSHHRTSSWVRHALPGLYDRSRIGYFEPPSWRPPEMYMEKEPWLPPRR
jgi:hypothetical protein